MIPTQIDKSLFPVIKNENYFENGIPTEDISQKKKIFFYITPPEEIIGLNNSNLKQGIKYDINRVSSKNAKKSEIGPYKTSFLREIILSHNMGKVVGTKNDLVNTILTYNENKSKK